MKIGMGILVLHLPILTMMVVGSLAIFDIITFDVFIVTGGIIQFLLLSFVIHSLVARRRRG